MMAYYSRYYIMETPFVLLVTVYFHGIVQAQGLGGAEKSTTAFDQWTREKTVWVRTR